jgi:hypothetical protein
MAEICRGLRVRVADAVAAELPGVLVHPDYLAARTPGAVGVVTDYCVGYGGDLWWVRHDTRPGDADGYAVYLTDELTPEVAGGRPQDADPGRDPGVPGPGHAG